LLLGPKDWIFCSAEESKIIYDAHFELCLSRMLDSIHGVDTADIECDTYASKPLSLTRKRYALSTRDFKGMPSATFGHRMKPLIANVLFDVPGETISLGEPDGFDTTHGNRRKSVYREVGFMNQRDRLILVAETLRNSITRPR
jgi:hypothetical protein